MGRTTKKQAQPEPVTPRETDDLVMVAARAANEKKATDLVVLDRLGAASVLNGDADSSSAPQPPPRLKCRRSTCSPCKIRTFNRGAES